MNAKGFSTADERRILDALGRWLLKEFPNPDRLACPGSDVLKRIASHKMPLSEADKWPDHLTSCSPCYSDFSKFREAFQRGGGPFERKPPGQEGTVHDELAGVLLCSTFA